MANHIQHLDDLPARGLDGYFKAYDFLTNVQNAPIYRKWDGAPALIIGYDNGDFFISTKSYFGKSPQLFKSCTEINESSLDEPLKKKLCDVFFTLQGVDLPYTVQGDFLWSSDDIFYQNGLACFQPNTLIYGVSLDDIADYAVGVVWHTDVDSGRPIDGLDLLDCWSPKVRVSQQNLNIDIGEAIDGISRYFEKMDGQWYDEITSMERFFTVYQRYRNYTVKNRQPITLAGFIKHVEEWYAIQIASKKTEAAMDRWKVEYTKLLGLLGEIHNSSCFFQIINRVNTVKLGLINTFNNSSSERILVHYAPSDMYVETGHEGYVVYEGGEAIKLVDRDKFSFYNFSPSISKGWNSQNRT